MLMAFSTLVWQTTPHSDPTADMRIGGRGRLWRPHVQRECRPRLRSLPNALSQADLRTLYSAASLPISDLADSQRRSATMPGSPQICRFTPLAQPPINGKRML